MRCESKKQAFERGFAEILSFVSLTLFEIGERRTKDLAIFGGAWLSLQELHVGIQ